MEPCQEARRDVIAHPVSRPALAQPAQLYRALAERNQEAFLSDLARSLHNLGALQNAVRVPGTTGEVMTVDDDDVSAVTMRSTRATVPR